MKRRGFVVGLAAWAALRFVKPKKTAAQFLTGAPSAGPPTGDFVTVTRGSSQAVIQVLKPTDHTKITTELAGGGSGAYTDAGYEYWTDNQVIPWAGGSPGLSAGQQADVISRQLIQVTQGQCQIRFSVLPADAAGEIVTVIHIGPAGDVVTPMTLAQAQALAPALFV